MYQNKNRSKLILKLLCNKNAEFDLKVDVYEMYFYIKHWIRWLAYTSFLKDYDLIEFERMQTSNDLALICNL